jgi:hypothetical protein
MVVETTELSLASRVTDVALATLTASAFKVADKAVSADVILESTDPNALITVDTTAESKLTLLSVDKCSRDVTEPPPPTALLALTLLTRLRYSIDVMLPPAISPDTVLIRASKEVALPSAEVNPDITRADNVLIFVLREVALPSTEVAAAEAAEA